MFTSLLMTICGVIRMWNKDALLATQDFVFATLMAVTAIYWEVKK